MKRRGLLPVVLIATSISLGGESLVGMEARPAGATPTQNEQMHPRRAAWITIHDPQDVEVCEIPSDCPVDIRAVSKRHFATATGRRMLALRLHAYKLWGGLIYIANIKFRLDSRAGPRPDAHIYMALTDHPASLGWSCGRTYHIGGTLLHRYRIKRRGDRLTCFVPRRELRPTKPIRLQALSRANEFIVDRAPDHGWGGG